MVALKILMDREDNPSEYNLEDEWDRQNHYPENEHDHYLHDHEHFGEDGFFCNPVGMSCKEDWVLFCKVKRMIYHICKESESVRVRVHVHLCVSVCVCKQDQDFNLKSVSHFTKTCIIDLSQYQNMAMLW